MIFRLVLALFLALTTTLQPSMAQTFASDQITRIEPVIRDGWIHIDADIDFTLSDELRDAAQKGVPIYFTADLQIVEKRWWWFDKTVVDTQRTWRVVYNALTRQWRIGTGDLTLPESSLDDALSLVRAIRGWSVAPVKDFEVDTTLYGRLRLRLDTSLLARPFQIDALNSRAWGLATPWKNFTFSVSAGASDPS
ncbi:DUF4390 domain-containing protein [Paracandidimonas soli]|uniref:Uncharacterized protein DUF4390 n=1 Tax=Paracandidimonas soli TaxID=1917182 RepID=A0A4R3VBV2_9BURK|nr:DUF4390 domain-containing protein [Paracandidimonas soli]TCV02766.1 uncharacterized protein DUF4390 [Paracandidimonas soli]